jgi:hypothetical protein
MNFFKYTKTTKFTTLTIILWLLANPMTFIFANTDTIEEIESIWRGGDFITVRDKAINYYNTTARTRKIVYLIGTSLCRINKQSAGTHWLQRLRAARNTPNQIRIIDNEIRKCSISDNIGTLETFPLGWVGIDGNMKDMQDYRKSWTKIGAGSLIFEPDGTVSERALGRRLVSKNKPELGISSVKYTLTGSANKGDSEINDYDDLKETLDRHQEFRNLYEGGEIKSFQASDSIILTCVSCSHSEPELKAIGQGLESYINFFSQEYGMKKPESFIKIYGATNDNYLQILAQQLHGVQMGLYIIGYSVSEDLSMVVIFPSWDHSLYGTSKHELFHLMIRDDFGDAPPWLEEGMAALYEGSEFKGTKIVGDQNWRELGLRVGANKRPSIKELVAMDWSQYNSEGREPEGAEALQFSKVAVTHATARYFMMYLDRKGKLAEIYKKMRETKIDDSFRLIKPDAKTVLEESLRKSIDEIDKDFINWFDKLPDITATPKKKNKSKRKKR